MSKSEKVYVFEREPIDWLYAAILERKAVFGLSLKDMARMCGISYELMRRYIRKSPWEWPKPVRERMCKAFGLKVNFGPECVSSEDGGKAWQNIS